MAHPSRDVSLLSPTHYDDDASSIHSERSDQDTDSEDDEVLMGARTSADIRAHDRNVLLEEEERDRLLEESRGRGRRGSALANVAAPLKKLFAKSTTDLSIGSGSGSVELGTEGMGSGIREKRKRRRDRRRQRKERLVSEASIGEDGHLMYEMEEGGMKDGSSTGSSSETEGSDELDRRGLKGLHDDKAARRRRWRRWCFIHVLIAVGFSILVLLSWKLSLNRKRVAIKQQTMMSNGTALFAPTTILISLDGFRADFLNRGITPRLNAFIAEGVSPVYMLPSFPSVTFPNHHTISTGLYPESHGVVGNTFWDEELQEEFFYTHPNSMDPKWWGGEPIWVTAETQGIRSAIHMWPGSEAHIMGVEPAFIDSYNGKEPLPNKVTRILELLDKPGQENKLAEVGDMRPQLIAAYVPNVDTDGHKYGPNSTEIRATIAGVDALLDGVFKGLEERNLTQIVNVVVVSDHGMATTDTSRVIQLEDILDTNLIEHMDGWPLFGLRPKNPADLQSLYDTLAAEAAVNPGFEVYLRDKNMPERYHFSKNERIAPLWMIPKTGWAIVTKKDFDVADAKAKGTIYHPRGLHGYDHEHPLMRAIFVARGPAFPHPPNSRVEPFQNTEVYNILCDSLGLEPRPNNGTLRLPLQPIGFHTPETMPEEPSDPVPVSVPTPPSPPSSPLPPSPPSPPSPISAGVDGVISISPIEASSAADPNEVPPQMIGVNPTDDASVDRPVVSDESSMTEDEKDFWEWFKDKLDKAKGWLAGLTGGKKEGEKEGEK
ncbi:nucleotide pyrophosphatase family protein [Hyaloscypha bicolor E]|uniref:Nucleotide pyrophosphatase family protein n=1 Tax=Hyaloscypha bicolor E TaxID=1095630 RepID=A0A2J6TJM6_9HELO|nr:nucleotide pyrophosphatase family protein [Hyaloscypha bicolor E]PMD63211.1 nucleotide pyrophosphatase family protein [Hyaloscypha bicolor E]